MLFFLTLSLSYSSNGELCNDFPNYCTTILETTNDISPLYQKDAFDWTVLILYFIILFVLTIYGSYRLKQVFDFWLGRYLAPKLQAQFAEAQLPYITVQLPIFNEMYVIERLLRAITEIDYPPEKFEIQVIDDSTDETMTIAEAAVSKYAEEGYAIQYIHRSDRTGFRAGALDAGMRTAKGGLLAIFDADFIPKRDCLRKLVHYFKEPVVGCVQMRWSHINGSYNLLTRLQAIMLDSHLVVEQTTRNRSSGFFGFDGTAGIWRRSAIEMSGGWEDDTLMADTDLSLRAQLVGWRFIYLVDEEAPAEIPVEINAFKAQRRRQVKGELQVGIKLFPRIWAASLPLRVKLEMFFRLTGGVIYPLLVVGGFLQFPLLLVRYNQPFHSLMIFDLPLLSFLLISVVMYYGVSVWYLRVSRASRLLHLPLVIALAFGLTFSNARAALEALVGVRSDFVRTPKYRVEEATDSTWKLKKYKRRHGWFPLLELSYAFYFLLAIIYAARFNMWFATPLLLLFFLGFGYTGLMSLLQTSNSRRFLSYWRTLGTGRRT
jgi:cellulose synthase/poly-beta-1,6-N-acetylglucosamine synthase-like glycosyltransferase